MNDRLSTTIKKSKYECILFDFFDTLMLRDCFPQEIKREWSKILTQKMAIQVSVKELYEMRNKTEEHLGKAQADGNGEYTYFQLCEALYNKLKYCNLISNVSIDEFKYLAYDIELRIEMEHQHLNEEIFQMVKILWGKGYKLCCVSDFYMPGDFVLECMKDKGLDVFFSHVFVSSDYLVSKRTGGLYDIVFRTLKLEPSKFLMVGDNYESDYLKSKEKGCDAKWIRNHDYGKISDKCKYHIIKEKIYSLYRRSKRTGIPYGTYGFSLFYFIDNLFRTLKNRNVNNVFFLSREGKILKELFDKYQQITFGEQTINTYYLYVSRLSTFTASLNPDIEQEAFNSLLRQYNYISPRNFLRSIGWSEGEIDELKPIAMISLDREIRDFIHSKEFEYLKTLDMFRKKYKTIVNTQKAYLFSYLQSFNINFRDEGLHIVDVGWKGSMQDNLSNLLKDVPIFGYYIGLLEGGNNSYNNKKMGILFDDFPLPSKCDYIWRMDYSFFERILYPGHGSVNAYKMHDGKVIPVLKTFSLEKGIKELVLPTQRQIEIVFTNLCNIFKITYFDSVDYRSCFMWLHLKTCLGMTKKEFILQGKLLDGHIENFALFTYGIMYRKLSFLKIYKICRSINIRTLPSYIIKLKFLLYSHNIPLLGCAVSIIAGIYYRLVLWKGCRSE